MGLILSVNQGVQCMRWQLATVYVFQYRAQIICTTAFAEFWLVIRGGAEDRRLVIIAKDFAGCWADQQSIDVKEG
jgi:hypothetical protein